MRIFIIVAIKLLAIAHAGVATAQTNSAGADAADSLDRIWIEPPPRVSSESDWYPRSIAVRLGEIKQFDAESLRIVFAGDEAETLIAADRVVWIERAGSSQQERAAVAMFREGNYAESLRPLLDVLAERPPVWRQQSLSMMAAYAAWRSSRERIALEVVDQLDERPLPPLTLAWLPIDWSGERSSAAARDLAVARLDDASPAVRLVSASWLLSGATRGQAIAVLQSLSTAAERPQIARLAACLQWRVAAPPEVKASSEKWRTQLDEMPLALQVGPTLTLIDKWRAAGNAEAARQLEMSLQLTPPIPHPAVNNAEDQSR